MRLPHIMDLEFDTPYARLPPEIPGIPGHFAKDQRLDSSRALLDAHGAQKRPRIGSALIAIGGTRRLNRVGARNKRGGGKLRPGRKAIGQTTYLRIWPTNTD
ncbi:hypothetical protein KM043_012594 [Ampulex compressa]|nr:hypothetical protein KM043_012594 [Ampulex compressa]